MTTTYKILDWQEVPSQIKAEDERDEVTLALPDRFTERIDQLAAKRGLQNADDYLAQWQWGEDSSGRERPTTSRRRFGPSSKPRSTGRAQREHAVSHDQRASHRGSCGLHALRRGRPGRRPCSHLLPLQGKCKECIVEVTDGMQLLAPRSSHERHLKGDFRLSCQCRIVGSGGVIQCHTMRRGHMRIERQALNLPVGGSSVSLDPAVIRQGSHIIDRITGKDFGESADPIHGLAMDLGTTTVVLRLIDLETGALVADASFENPQRFGGSDVMSRIHFDTEHKGKLLRRTLAGYLTHAIEEFPVDPTTIYEVVVVGNSTMRDLFFRQNVYSIGQNPYRSITEIEMAAGNRTTTSLIETGRRCLLPVHPEARVYGLPIISGHVGADAAACMLAVRMAEEERLVAIMDIGTNTELILGNKHRILAASCPAGPAFEGGAIACGMPGLDGAVEYVMLDDSGTFTLGVIGEGVPEGICGSGLVDLMSELLRTGRMNEMGRFADGVERFTLDEAHDSSFSRATSTNWPRPREPTSPACTWCSATMASRSTTWRCFILPVGSDGT